MEDQFSEIFKEISNTKCTELKNELIYLAIRYSRIRVDWKLSDAQQRIEMEESRTRCHNVFIDAFNILSRTMEKEGEKNDWRKELGDDRKVIGDFACYVHYKLGIEAG